ncbi:hypothetical protein URH17368_2346 [Alicyclobacillus hesperidum URH17-3-68]|nr:hypothetical protein URH17368_2346 [Alicyclobacillus hesperidum URH17-3-68]
MYDVHTNFPRVTYTFVVYITQSNLFDIGDGLFRDRGV